MLYYSLFTIIALIGFGEQFAKYYKNGRMTRVFFSAVIVTIFFLSALRWERGTDWNSYLLFFKNPWTNWDTHYEWGFTALNRLFRKFTDNYSYFLAFQTGLYLILSVRLFNKISNYYPEERPVICSLLLYQYAGSFAGLFTTRSQIAGILCALALYEIREKRLPKFILLVVIATLFHTSSLAILIAYPIFHIKTKDKTFYIVLIALSILGIISPTLIMRLIAFIPRLQRYSVYIHLDSVARITVGVAKWGLLWGISLWTSNKADNEWAKGYTRIIAIGAVIYLWSTIYGNVLNRMSGLFLSGAYFIIPEFLHRFKGRQKVIMYAFFVGWCLINFYTLYNGNYHPLYEPYKSIFDNFSVVTSVPN